MRGGKNSNCIEVEIPFGECPNVHFFVAQKKFQNLYIYAMARERSTATLSSMGLRAEASLAKHLLLENCWENNLLPDISKVDYLEGHQGRTNLQILDGLPLFVDDIYARRYLDQTETVRIGGKVSCEPVSKQIVARISMAAHEVLGNARKNTRISSTVLPSAKGSKIMQNDCENRERHRTAGKKAVEKALSGEGGVRVFCSENRRVGGRDRPSCRSAYQRWPDFWKVMETACTKSTIPRTSSEW